MSDKADIALRREVGARDVELMAHWLADREVTRFLNEKPGMSGKLKELLHSSQMDIFTHHFNHGSRFYLVDLQGNGEPIGYLRLIPKTDKTEMAIVIADKEKWNRGFGTRAVWEGLKEAFLNLRFEKVEAKIHRKNKPSRRVFKKAGFEKRGGREEKETFQLTFEGFLALVA